MLRYLVAFLIFDISTEAQNNFTPGCSFSNGQCIYNVKLGHEQHCDVSTRNLNNQNNNQNNQQPTGTGGTATFQTCSCKDVDGLNKNVATLWNQMNQLQTNMETITKAFNISKDQLGRKDWQIVGLLSQNNNLTELLANKDMLLNKSQIDLANTVQQMAAEITRLRNELANSNKDLSVCKATLNVTGLNAEVVLYGNYKTYHFDFEDTSFSNFTVSTCSSSSTECWLRGAGRQNTMSGPQEDHTFGAPQGHYMYIDPYRNPSYGSSHCTSSYTHASRTATMTSPEFPPASEYCVRFWYTLYGSDIQNLKVYAKVGGGNGYPVMAKTGQEDKYWHMAQISLTSEYTASPFRLVFETSTRSYYYNDYHSSISKHVCDGYGYTAFDDVYVYNTSCNAIVSCPPGSHKLVDGNSTSCYTFNVQAASWYDAIKTCKSETLNSHLVSVNSAKEQKFLVDAIKQDTGLNTAGTYGWYTSGNDEKDEGIFVWSDTGYPYPLNYTNWHVGQPNNVGSVQDCLLMEYAGDDYEWGDVNCNDKHPFICETHV